MQNTSRPTPSSRSPNHASLTPKSPPPPPPPCKHSWSIRSRGQHFSRWPRLAALTSRTSRLQPETGVEAVMESVPTLLPDSQWFLWLEGPSRRGQLTSPQQGEAPLVSDTQDEAGPFPAPEMPGEQQAESDPTVTSRQCWGSWAIRDMVLKGPLGVLQALLPGEEEPTIKREWQLCPQNVRAKPVFRRKITVTRNSPVHQRPVVRSTNELYSDLGIL